MRQPRKMTQSEKDEMLGMIERMSTSMRKRFPMSETSIPPSQLSAAEEVQKILHKEEEAAPLPKEFFSFFEIERTANVIH